MHSIRFRITAVLMAAILTVVLALGWIGVLTIRMESDSSSAEKMHLISQNTQMLLDTYLNSLQQSVDMAVHIAVDSLDGVALPSSGKAESEAEVAQLSAALGEHCAAVQHAFGSIANHTSGIVTYYYCINSDLGSTEHGFFYSRLEDQDFVEQEPLDSSQLDPDDIEHTTWYYSPIRSGKPIWIGPYKAHFLGELWTVSYVSPIYKDGKLIGVLGMDILFRKMTSQIRTLQVYDTGFVSLLDEDGRVLYHPELEIGNTSPEREQELGADFFRKDSSGDSLVRYTVGGEKRQLAFSTLSNGMKVVVVAPVSEITASRRQVTRLMLIVAAVILAVFTVITVLSMKAVTEPLLRLTAASRRLAAGDYEVELDYAGKDEVGALTNAFRQMRDHLYLLIRDLNSRAYRDAMTGVRNQGAFDLFAGELNEKLHAENAEETPAFAVLMFDCNRLKLINDRYGHEYGNLYLQKACGTICRIFAHSPVFRMGGDEFAAVLQNRDYEQREQLISDFEEAVREINATAKKAWERVDMAKGLAVFRPGEDENVEQVLHRADERMYAEKKQIRRHFLGNTKRKDEPK